MIMVTSALAGEGKTFSAVNLAMSIAMELDNTVLLVDADVANPTLPEILRFSSPKGLMNVLTDPAIRLPDVLLRTNVPKLSILPAGAPHRRATELLASEAMERLIADVANRYADRIVIFDAPPLLPTTESRVLATHMGQIVVVVEADKTSHSALKQALAAIESCPIVLTMLNKAARSDVGSYYGYRGYGYGQ
jgi:receptor protein-tyrosine kinase